MTPPQKVIDKRLEALRQELQAKCEDAEKKGKELEDLRRQMLRLQADFENVKKRWLREQAEFQEVANGELLKSLLEIYDDFGRALAAGVPPEGEGEENQEVKTFRAGLEMIAKRMEGFLKSYGVVPIEAVGQPFDPTQHEAVAHEPTDSVPESTVVSELRKGYLMNGRVLRHAVVKVAVKSEGG